MAKKKKKEKVGTIKGLDLVKATRGEQARPFRTGYYQTNKDKPRKKDWRNWE